MNQIKKKPLRELGYNFVDRQFLPLGKDEYYLRNEQSGIQHTYRKLTAHELEVLVRNDNTSDDWNNIFVAEAFNPQLVQHCHFFGLVRIGKLEPYYLEFNNVRLPVGLYNSTISSCDLGDNVVVQNVNFLSHYIIGNEVIIANVNEMSTTDYAKFGNGIVKEGESESIRIWMELCNENGGRSVIPFDGMLAGDAYLWTRYREDNTLMDRFKDFTEKKFDKRRGYYGMVGDRTVIKNCKIIKDVTIGTDAYLKGANKLKNLTVSSSAEAYTQIGEGCEIVNGIIGHGCRIFYGVKAVRFIMASHSQLKYGARLINSYLGNNSTISCCEVLNSLIFPSHEQHHNNSFLCAALLQGQSNMAAGATVGSNHNSRAADGEITAGRGFWPGLCVSLKHNSKFASFTLIAKGNYMHELNIPFPFSLVTMDEFDNTIKIMPGYWFVYNMYGLARNSRKYVDRDKRKDKTQLLEFDYLAPDSVEELMDSLKLIEKSVGKTWYEQNDPSSPLDEESLRKKGKDLLLNNPEEVSKLKVYIENIENSNRKVELLKLNRSYPILQKLVGFYATKSLMAYLENNKAVTFDDIQSLAKSAKRGLWCNVGGQMIRQKAVEDLKTKIKDGTFCSWDDLHNAYKKQGQQYSADKLQHSLACLMELHEISPKAFTPEFLGKHLEEAVATFELFAENIYKSREKDHKNPFRRMSYENEAQMDAVVGKLEDNSFINQTKEDLELFKQKSKELTEKWTLKVSEPEYIELKN